MGRAARREQERAARRTPNPVPARGLPVSTSAPVPAGAPVMATSPRTGRPVSSDAIAAAIVTPADGPFRGRTDVTWREAADAPLCLLTPDMQNRRIIDQLLRAAGGVSKIDPDELRKLQGSLDVIWARVSRLPALAPGMSEWPRDGLSLQDIAEQNKHVVKPV